MLFMWLCLNESSVSCTSLYVDPAVFSHQPSVAGSPELQRDSRAKCNKNCPARGATVASRAKVYLIANRPYYHYHLRYLVVVASPAFYVQSSFAGVPICLFSQRSRIQAGVGHIVRPAPVYFRSPAAWPHQLGCWCLVLVRFFMLWATSYMQWYSR